MEEQYGDEPAFLELKIKSRAFEAGRRGSKWYDQEPIQDGESKGFMEKGAMERI